MSCDVECCTECGVFCSRAGGQLCDLRIETLAAYVSDAENKNSGTQSAMRECTHRPYTDIS